MSSPLVCPRRVIMRLAVVLALSLAVMSASVAIGAKRRSAPAAGQLHASSQGPASITYSGQVVAFGDLTQPARVVVRGRGRDFRVLLNGEVQRPSRRGIVRLRSVTGSYFIQGRRVSFTLRGSDLVVSMAGKGTARLRGEGTYRLNNRPEAEWTRARIKVEPERTKSRRRERRR